MKLENMQESFVDKLKSLRKKLAVRFPSMEMQDFEKILAKIAHFHYKKKKGLIMGEHREVYQFLIGEGLNPFTVYRWLLLERVPEDIRFRLKEREISQKKAVSLAFRRKHETREQLTESVRIVGLGLIRRM